MQRKTPVLIGLGMLSGFAEPLFGEDEHALAPIETPVGAWSCVLYEELASENESLLMRFHPDGATEFARRRGDEFRTWAPVSTWTARRHSMSFGESRTGREFEADLRRSSLGGTWTSETSHGGWWCARLDDAIAADPDLQGLTARKVMPPLVAHGSTTPYYPLPAIRQAREGHAAVCFLVESTGAVVQPEFIELSDEIFRETTRRAVLASTYRGWRGEPALRPGCRTFAFEFEGDG